MKKFMFFKLLLLVTLFIVISCDKSQTSIERENLVLVSPDGKINLATSTDELVSKVKSITGLNEIVSIDKTEFPKASAGYYAIVTYSKKDGAKSNIVL